MALAVLADDRLGFRIGEVLDALLRSEAKLDPVALVLRVDEANPTFSTRIETRFFYGSESEKVLSFQGVTVSNWL